MAEQTKMETIKVEGGQLIDQIKRLIHEGNVRRIIITQDERIVAEFPLTLGVIGVMLAPVLAAVGALAALLSNCAIQVERFNELPTEPAKPLANGQTESVLSDPSLVELSAH